MSFAFIVLRTGHVVEPFMEPPDALPYAESTWQDERARIAGQLGATVHIVEAGQSPADVLAAQNGPAVVLADHCVVSEKALKDFVKTAASAALPGPAALALCRTPGAEYARPASTARIEPLDQAGPGARPAGAKGPEADATERVVYDCFFVPDPAALGRTAGALPPADQASPTQDASDATGTATTNPGQALLAALRTDAAAVVVKKREIVVPVRLPILGDDAAARDASMLDYPITSTVCVHVEHWVHLLWLNHQAFGIRWNELVRAKPVWVALRALSAFSLSRPKIMAKMVRTGRGCEIHPTAHVEGCILGDGVKIGARATVRNCILADGVEIGDHASVLASVLSKDVYVTPKSFCIWSLADQNAVISNYKLQVSVLGKGASTSTWAGLIDAKFQGAVQVMVNGTRKSTERQFLGSAVGHRAHVGAKVLILPGRSVPNDTTIAMRPDELVHEVAPDLPTDVPLVRHGGRLVPLSELR